MDVVCPDGHGEGWAVPRDAMFAIGAPPRARTAAIRAHSAAAKSIVVEL